MGKKKYSEEQRIGILKESKSVKKMVNGLVRLKQLEKESRRLKKLVAKQELDIMILKYLNEKNF